MLLKLREKTSGWIAGAIVAILVVPFALVGVGDYFTTRTETWVAKVGEAEIGPDAFRSRFEDYRQQVRRTMGDNYDPRAVEQPAVKRRLLDQMIDEELTRQAAARLGLVVPAAELGKEIADISAFHVDGRFDKDQYRMLLGAQNMTPRGFEQEMLKSLQARALPSKVQSTAFASNADVDRYLALRDQRRDLRFVLIEAPAADAVAAPTEEELQAFHAEHADRYMTEEQVEIEYVEIDSASIEVPEVADESTLRQRYEEQRARYVEPEQRLASHILIRVAENADADTQRQAQARAADLAEQARASGADFAALAREHSEDPGSKASGGDLGWLEQGLTDPAFETALYALAPGAISEPVKSSEGWHVIQLREVREGKTRPFEDARAELEREFQETERERRFNDLAGRLVDTVYRDPTSLKTSADELGLEVRRAGPFGRAGGDAEIAAHPKVLEAAFSDSVLVEGNVSDVIDLGNGKMVAIRVLEHLRPQPIPLEQIREQVAQELTAERRAALASEKAAAAMKRIEAGETLEAVAADLGAEVQEAKDVARMAAAPEQAIVTESFRLPHPADGKPTHGKVDLGGDRHALVELLAVRDGDPSAAPGAERTALREQLAQVLGATEVEGLMQAIRSQIPVQVAEQRL